MLRSTPLVCLWMVWLIAWAINSNQQCNRDKGDLKPSPGGELTAIFNHRDLRMTLGSAGCWRQTCCRAQESDIYQARGPTERQLQNHLGGCVLGDEARPAPCPFILYFKMKLWTFNVYFGCSLLCKVKIYKRTIYKWLHYFQYFNLAMCWNIGTVHIYILHIHTSRINFMAVEQYILKSLKSHATFYDKI